ncbi:MAG: cell division protein FtsB [Burkholderiales bacterium]
MKLLALLLLVLIAAIQSPLWFGKGGWLRVWEINQGVEAQKKTNEQLRVRNAMLSAEVRDLKQGYEAIEERARSTLGMIKPGELFIQVIDPPALGVATPLGAPSVKAVSDSR